MATSQQNVVDSHGDAHIEGASVLTYAIVFVALLVLLFISVGVAYIPNQNDNVRNLLTTIGFSIAGAKALLVILYFMHVKFGSRLTMIFAFGSFFFLAIMFSLTMNDYWTQTPVIASEKVTSYPAETGAAEGYKEPTIRYPGPTDTETGK
jgi:cytochrome c oxidase subunit 4